MKAKPSLALEFQYQGQTKRFESTQSKCKIGRSPICEFPLPEVHVISREHLMLELKNEQVWMTDLNSSNGSFYQGKKLSPQVAHLFEGGVLFLGTPDQGLSVKIEVRDGSELTASKPIPAVLTQSEALTPVREMDAVSGGDATQVKIIPPQLTQVALPASVDENLLQMQLVEEELAELIRKKEQTASELEDLRMQETEFKRLEANYQSQQAELILLKTTLEDVRIQMILKQGEIKQIDTELDATQVQLKSHTLLVAEKSLELDEKLKVLQTKQIELTQANMAFQLINQEAENKKAEMKHAEEVTLACEETSRRLAAEQLAYEEGQAQREQDARTLELQLSALEAERENFARVHREKTETEQAAIEALFQAKAEAEKSFELTAKDLAKAQKNAQLERESFEAAASLRKAIVEREVEEIVTRKIVVIRELEDLKRLIADAEKTRESLSNEHQKIIAASEQEVARIQTLEKTSAEIVSQIARSEDDREVLEHKIKSLEQEISDRLKAAEAAREQLLKDGENERARMREDVEASLEQAKSALSAEQAEIRAQFAQSQKALEDAQATLAQNHAEALARLRMEEEAKQSAIDQKFSDLEADFEKRKQAIVQAEEAQRFLIESERAEDLAEFDRKRDQFEQARIAHEESLAAEKNRITLEIESARAGFADELALHQAILQGEKLSAAREIELSRNAFRTEEEAHESRLNAERDEWLKNFESEREALRLADQSGREAFLLEFEVEKVNAAQAISDLQRIHSEKQDELLKEEALLVARFESIRDVRMAEEQRESLEFQAKLAAEREASAEEWRLIHAENQRIQEELANAHETKIAELEAKRKVIEQEQADQSRLFAVQFEEASRRAHQAHDVTIADLKAQASEMRKNQAEELRVWTAQEDARIKTLAAKNATAFAHHVAMRSLAEYQNESSVQISSLISTLEKKIVEALNGQVQGEGIYNPDFKTGVRKFWMQAAVGSAAVIAILCGIQYGPQIVGAKLETLKVANQQEDARFMLEVKAQRERMLALNLQAKDGFQDQYVDNVLYNPGYLAMKLDPEIQKQWTIVLQKFFLNELLFDERKVVEFMPIESSLMAGLNETYKILNSRNFEVNLPIMKKLEQEKAEEMWLLVGGRENWSKLRRREAEFFAQHTDSAKSGRIPSSK